MLLSDKDLEQAYEALQAQGNKIADASEFTDDACMIADDLLVGDQLTFLADKSSYIEFRKGELTVVAGASGHGKSALMGQIALDLASQGRKVCILSLEMPPARTLYRMGPARRFRRMRSHSARSRDSRRHPGGFSQANCSVHFPA